MALNWAKLVGSGRAKDIGVPWSPEEQKAIHEEGVPPQYVRMGILTKQDLEKAQKAGVNPAERQALEQQARALGVSFSPDVNDATLERHVTPALKQAERPRKPNRRTSAKLATPRKLAAARPVITSNMKDNFGTYVLIGLGLLVVVAVAYFFFREPEQDEDLGTVTSTTQATVSAANLVSRGDLTVTDDATISGGVLTVTTSNTATSTVTVGCVQTYATSTVTPIKQRFVTTGATSTFDGTVYWSYGTCP